MKRKLALVAAEATFYFVVGVGLCAMHWSVRPFDSATAGFERRWDGTCGGWTRELAIVVGIANLLLWWAYSAIAVTILRLHPVVTTVPESRATVRLTGAFVMLCGLTHLMGAYTIVNPVYRFEAGVMFATALISDVSVFFVGAGLIRVFEKRNAYVADLERKAVRRRSRKR